MKQIGKKLTALLLAVLLVLPLCGTAFAARKTETAALAEKTAEYILRMTDKPQVGSVGGEWAIIGLSRIGADVPQTYWDNYYKTVEKYAKAKKGVLHTRKYTEYSRVIVALTAIGANPSDVAGYNLLTPLGDFEKTVWQGLNGPIWALIALDSGNYDMPRNPEANVQATRQMYIDEILSRQLDDGGWNLSSRGGSAPSDPDITGMALQALAKYQNQTAVKTATDKALACLSKMQDAGGGFSSYGEPNSESCVQVIVALCELGISPEDARFVKNGNSVLDALLSYRHSDGSFSHIAGDGSNAMATEQGLYALAAVVRAAENRASLYRMTDVAIRVSGGKTTSVGLDGKHGDVCRVPVSQPGTTFDDVSGHPNQAAVEALADRGIISGMGNGTFQPDATMTRAQFATIVTRALGLVPGTTNVFSDVPAGQWYAGYVGTAYSYGIVNGVGNGKFAPLNEISRQEAAVMIARAARLCGMDTSMTATEIRNVLSQFGDYVTVASWAQESMAFCYREGILDESVFDIEPKECVLRCEIAQILYNLLEQANLL